MTRSHVGKEASASESKSITRILERVGKDLQPFEIAEIINNLPKDVVSDKEKLTRFLLLATFLDQQVKAHHITPINLNTQFSLNLRSYMSRLTNLIQGKLALADCCPIDKSHMDVIKGEDHMSYGGGYYLYFLQCQRNHRWLRVITQYDEAPPTLLKGWIAFPREELKRK